MATRKTEARSEARTQAVSSGDVIEELRRSYDRLTQSQKRIAEFIVEHPQAVAFSTVDQMAAQLDVNPSTIVRFTYRLGLNGFPDLQERMREMVRGQLARTGNPISEHKGGAHLGGTSFGASLSHDWQNLHYTIENVNPDMFGRAINILARARRVYVVAGFSTFPVAQYFAVILDRLRSDVTLLSANDAFATFRIAEIKSEDCVVAFTFPRYAAATHRVVGVGQGAPDQGYRRHRHADLRGWPDCGHCPARRFGRHAACRIPWSRRWRSPTHCSTASRLPGARAPWSATALHDDLMNRWDAFLLKLDGAD